LKGVRVIPWDLAIHRGGRKAMQALAHMEKFPAGLLRPYLTAAVAFLGNMRVE
jgi:hypothetical protein